MKSDIFAIMAGIYFQLSDYYDNIYTKLEETFVQDFLSEETLAFVQKNTTARYIKDIWTDSLNLIIQEARLDSNRTQELQRIWFDIAVSKLLGGSQLSYLSPLNKTRSVLYRMRDLEKEA